MHPEMVSSLPAHERKEQAALLNREFHLVLARLSGNTRLADLIQTIMDDMERLLVADPYLADPSQHRKILAALMGGDKIQAHAAMEQHIKETMARIVNRF